MKARRGELTKVGSLFDKYLKVLKPPQSSVEKVACEVINEVVGCRLLPHQVSYTVATRTLYVKAPGLIRTEVTLKRTEVLYRLKERLPGNDSPETLL